MDTNINPGPAHAAGHDLTALAQQPATTIAHDLDTTTVAANAHPGWQVSAIAAACQNAWETHMGYLVGEIDRTAQKIHTTAGNIQQADTEAARRLTDILTELSH